MSIHENPLDDSLFEREDEALNRYPFITKDERDFLKQKSKEDWLSKRC